MTEGEHMQKEDRTPFRPLNNAGNLRNPIWFDLTLLIQNIPHDHVLLAMLRFYVWKMNISEYQVHFSYSLNTNKRCGQVSRCNSPKEFPTATQTYKLWNDNTLSLNNSKRKPSSITKSIFWECWLRRGRYSN